MRLIDANMLIKAIRGDAEIPLTLVDKVTELINMQQEYFGNGWIPADQPPKDENYVLLSFENFSALMVGRYEEDNNGGAYYAGDEDVSLVSQDMIVNAWQPLPEPYEEGEYCFNGDCPFNTSNGKCIAWDGCGGYEQNSDLTG